MSSSLAMSIQNGIKFYIYTPWKLLKTILIMGLICIIISFLCYLVASVFKLDEHNLGSHILFPLSLFDCFLSKVICTILPFKLVQKYFLISFIQPILYIIACYFALTPIIDIIIGISCFIIAEFSKNTVAYQIMIDSIVSLLFAIIPHSFLAYITARILKDS